jgi:hypothetical protein
MMQKCSFDLAWPKRNLLLAWFETGGGALARLKGVHTAMAEWIRRRLMVIEKRFVD